MLSPREVRHRRQQRGWRCQSVLMCLVSMGWLGKGQHDSFSPPPSTPQETGCLPALRTEYINPASWSALRSGLRAQDNTLLLPAVDPAHGPWSPLARGGRCGQ